MNSLFMIIELILAIFLARSTNKTSKNSGKPSSQTDKDESALVIDHVDLKSSVVRPVLRQQRVCFPRTGTAPCNMVMA